MIHKQELLFPSHPQPQSPLPNKPFSPLQQHNKRMIQIKLLPHPQLLFPQLLPQPVAAKSLISVTSEF